MYRLLIVDISNFIHRAYHVHKDLYNSKGFPTGAIYGTLSMIGNLVKYNRFSHMVICCDPRNDNSLRKSIYPEYKANRPTTNGIDPQELIIRELMKEIGIPVLEVEGYEADDLIGTISRRFSDEIKVTIVSGDKDLMVLADDNTSILDTMKKKEFFVSDVKTKYKINPYQISDYLALIGDKADNIPGAKGIGPVAAVSLLSKFETIEDIYKDIEEITPKQREILEKQKDQVLVSKKLANLFYNVPIDIKLSEMKFEPKITQRFESLCRRLEFNDSTIQTLASRFLQQQ